RGLEVGKGAKDDPVERETLDAFGTLAVDRGSAQLDAVDLALRGGERLDLVRACADWRQVEPVLPQLLDGRAAQRMRRDDSDPELVEERGQRLGQAEAHQELVQRLDLDRAPEFVELWRAGEEGVAQQVERERDVLRREGNTVLPQNVLAQGHNV